MPREKPTRASRRNPRPAQSRPRSGSTLTLLLGVVAGIAAAVLAVWLYHRYQRSNPVSSRVTSSEQPLSPTPPRHIAPARPAPQPAPAAEVAPFGISEDVFESGARLYSSRCASCHGTPRHSAALPHPTAVQLWRPNHTAGGTGVSHQTPAHIHRSIAEGQPAAGMPAYCGVLTSTQLWQLSLLLSNAGQDLPDPVLHLLEATKP